MARIQKDEGNALFRFRRDSALIPFALMLVACTTPAQRQLEHISAGTEQLWAQYGACMREVEASLAYQRLERAYIFRSDDPRSIEKMAIDRLATDQEKQDLVHNQRNISDCNQHLFAGFAEKNPSFNVLLSRFMSEDKQLILQTVQEEVSVGERNQLIQQSFPKRLRDWNFAGERLVRLYSWRSRRNCSLYSCSGPYLASLLPTSSDWMTDSPEAGSMPINDDLAFYRRHPRSSTGSARLSQATASPQGKQTAESRSGQTDQYTKTSKTSQTVVSAPPVPSVKPDVPPRTKSISELAHNAQSLTPAMPTRNGWHASLRVMPVSHPGRLAMRD